MLREVALLFLKLGVIGFGGPAAHIAMMRDEVVRRRRWMDDQELLDWVGATNLVPGPNSTELAIHLGHQRAGWKGLLVAGLCFIGPAVLIVGVIAWLYERHGQDPVVVDVRYGVLPVIIAIVAQALAGLLRTAVKDVALGVLAAAAFAAHLLDVHELLILGAGALAGALRVVGGRLGRRLHDLGPLFLVFLEIGAVLYGSGYVLLAFLESRLVDDLGWLTEQQVLDAVAVGQVTPGPVFTTATFVGWQVDGVAGAAVSTVGIFAPAFVFVAVLGKVVPWMRRTPWARGALDGVNAASLGLLGGVLVEVARTAFPDASTVALAVVALVVLLRWSPNSAWLVAAGVAIGLAHGALT